MRKRVITLAVGVIAAVAFGLLGGTGVLLSGEPAQEPQPRPAPGAVDVAPPLPDDRFQHVLRLRESLGLRADPAFVRSLYDLASGVETVTAADSRYFNMPVTPDEAAALNIRFLLQSVLGVHGDAIHRDLGPLDAGVILSDEFGPQGAILIQTAGPIPDATKQSILSRLGPEVQQYVRFREVPHSLQDLRAAVDEIGAYLASRGIEAGTGTTPQEGSVLVMIYGPADDALMAEIRSLVAPIPVTVWPYARIVDQGKYKNDDIGYALVEGGQTLNNGYGDACTSGFAVHGYYGPFLLTAGHCSGLDQVWYQAGQVAGE
jgi:hypothetical protein